MFKHRIDRRNPLTERLFRRFFIKYFARSLLFDLQLLAKQETIAYIRAHMTSALIVRDRWALLKLALERLAFEGLVLEFGVEKGRSLNWLAHHRPGPVHGFDSFQGLPADWTGAFERKGSFSTGGRLPKVSENVELHAGWFTDSLPPFLKKHDGPAALIHVDCDIYESTRTVFDLLAERIVAGTIIVFDEYFNYPNWQQHEFKAFKEFVEERHLAYEYVAFAEKNGHVMVRILGPRQGGASSMPPAGSSGPRA